MCWPLMPLGMSILVESCAYSYCGVCKTRETLRKERQKKRKEERRDREVLVIPMHTHLFLYLLALWVAFHGCVQCVHQYWVRSRAFVLEGKREGAKVDAITVDSDGDGKGDGKGA